MHCIFCGKEIVPTQTEGVLYCDSCGVIVDMNNKSLRFNQSAPSYLRESYEALQVIVKTKPDIAIASEQLFSEQFNKKSVHMYYKTRVNLEETRRAGYTAHTYGGSDFTPHTFKLLSMKNILSYGFYEMLAKQIMCGVNTKTIPILRLDMCSASRYLWQLFIAHNIETEIPYEVMSALFDLVVSPVTKVIFEDVQPYRLSDEQYCCAIAQNLDILDIKWPKDLQSCCRVLSDFNINSYNDNIKYFTINDYEKAIHDRYTVIDKRFPGQSKLVRELMANYAKSKPDLSLFYENADNFTLFNPKCEGCVDTAVFDMLLDKHVGGKIHSLLSMYYTYTSVNAVVFSDLSLRFNFKDIVDNRSTFNCSSNDASALAIAAYKKLKDK